MNFAKALKLARNSKGYSQQRLAELTGIARTNLSAYENSKILPGLETVIKMSDALEMPVSELIACGEECVSFSKKRASHFLKSKNPKIEIPILDQANLSHASFSELIPLFNKGHINELPKKSIKLPVTESAYLLKVESDAMAPKMMPEDLIWVESDSSKVRPDDIVVVQLKNERKEPFVRYVHFNDDGGYIFTAENRKYSPLSFHADEILYIHRWVFTIPKQGIRRFISV